MAGHNTIHGGETTRNFLVMGCPVGAEALWGPSACSRQQGLTIDCPFFAISIDLLFFCTCRWSWELLNARNSTPMLCISWGIVLGCLSTRNSWRFAIDGAPGASNHWCIFGVAPPTPNKIAHGTANGMWFARGCTLVHAG